MLLVVGLLFIGIGLYSFQAKGSTDGGSILGVSRLYNLPDIDPALQGGTYKKDFDIYFEASADEFGVPFALLKAHAFRESSLKDRAFRDENPTKRTDRIGWAARGLMQLLYWPGSDRFVKYGFSASRNADDMYEPNTNIRIAAQLIRDNLNACGGNLRDAINMYNTGKKEAQYQAPGNYVNNVISTYETLIKRSV